MPVMYFKCQNNSLLFKVSIKLLLVSLITSADVRESLFSGTDVEFGDIVSSSIDDGCRSMTVQRIKRRVISNWNQSKNKSTSELKIIIPRYVKDKF